MLACTLAIASQKFHFPPLKKCELKQTLKIKAGKTPWSVDCYRDLDAHIEHYEAEGFAVIRKRGIEVARCVPLEFPFCNAYLVNIHPGYPVIAIRGEWGLGEHWDTIIFAVRHGRLIRMGRPPAQNSNGPILWHDNPKIWAFDNYDRYESMDHSLRLACVLYRIGPDGKLQKWRTVRTPHPHIPITIHTEDDLDMPKSGL
jgi:hypothetical protein